jgi:hypothetical protein
MSGATQPGQLYSAIEESARLAGAAFSRDKVWPILAAYGDLITDGRIVFSVKTGERHAGELEYTVQVSPGADNPYAHALSNGLVAGTGQPIGALLSDIQARFPVNEYLIDCGVVSGFQKVYTIFRGLQAMSKLASIPSIPPALVENADFFTRYGMHDTAIIGIDYRHGTMNVYFEVPAAISGNLEPKTIVSMLREGGFPEPNDRILEYACGSQKIYATLSWDSSKIQRLSFAPPAHRGLDLSTLPVRLEPDNEQFMRGAPHTYPGELVGIATVKWSLDDECLDLGTVYQVSPAQLQAMPL